VGFDVLTTCQPSTVWWSGKTASGGCSAGQGSSEPVAPRIYYIFIIYLLCIKITYKIQASDLDHPSVLVSMVSTLCNAGWDEHWVYRYQSHKNAVL
jgi:hypothetical protein